MNFLLRVIAFAATIYVSRELIPSFDGGLFTGFAIMILSALTSPKKEEENEHT